MSVNIGGSSKTKGYQCTTSSIEMQEQEAPLPNVENRGYFQVRTSFCQRFPDVITQKMKNGSERMLKLKQVLLSGIIQFEEIKLHQWRYEYRAEVSYLMTANPPMPFISKNQGAPGRRRRSLNPVPLSGTGIANIYRKVDAIIVEEPENLWCGQGTICEERMPQVPNIARVVEVKFPGDRFRRNQKIDNIWIAGDKNKFTVLEIHDCRAKTDKERDTLTNELLSKFGKIWPWLLIPPVFGPGAKPPYIPPVPIPGKHPEPKPLPGGSPIPTHSRNLMEPWTQQETLVVQEAQSIGGLAGELYEETLAVLRGTAVWMQEAGEWMYDQSREAYVWLKEGVTDLAKSSVIFTIAQVLELYLLVKKWTDWTIEFIKSITFVDVLWVLGGIVVGIAIGVVAGVIAVPASVYAAIAGLLGLLGVSTAATANDRPNGSIPSSDLILMLEQYELENQN
ncbi:VRR-NUC domain-containing protein [Serratia silvae]|uniref:VRR-NUC domain-containing protein n=2 Tax=Serratia silvae TaxID=2824122 RepID=A0ABT0K8M0_9GAMM|nr:VRR-NUC domain-containing protein [Serratia silvae]MCL1028370.1 VRR-NUC domain-containing protein [Serratia silvae]